MAHQVGNVPWPTGFSRPLHPSVCQRAGHYRKKGLRLDNQLTSWGALTGGTAPTDTQSTGLDLGRMLVTRRREGKLCDHKIPWNETSGRSWFGRVSSEQMDQQPPESLLPLGESSILDLNVLSKPQQAQS